MFQLTDEQTLLRQSLEAYLRGPRHWGRGWSPSAWNGFAAELGVLAAPLPEEFGGLGCGAVASMVIMQAFGEQLTVQPYVASITMAAATLATAGGERCAALLAGIMAGEQLAAIAGRAYAPGGRMADGIAARRNGAGWHLHGRCTMVQAAPWASHLLVAAQDAGRPLLFLLPVTHPGLTLSPVPCADGMMAADIDFNNVMVSPEDMLAGPGTALALLEAMEDAAAAALCAEAVGLMHAMFAQTITYLQQRQQFGKTLSSFQVLRHRIADMHIKCVHAQSMAHGAALAQTLPAPRRALIVSAAKAYVGEALNFVARLAVQLHGGIGMMQETPVAHYFKRATLLQRQAGSTAWHLSRFTAMAGGTLPGTGDILAELAGGEAAGDAAFRAAIRGFIASEFTPDMREAARRDTGNFAGPELSRPWQAALAARGWAAPAWPVRHGGPGWSPRQRQIFAAEMELAGAPRLPAMGLQMCGPVLMRFGTKAQQDFFLPRIISGEHYWAQGYSEPGAGSDLAALRLAAIRDGDEYVLNGTKIWTTFAQHANWIFVLARTGREGKPQAGISFLLLPLDTPGITIRPLISISGQHEVNQIFFDDVRVPVGNLVGAENGGWQVAKYLLEFERGVGHQVPALLRSLIELRALAQTPSPDGSAGFWQDAAFRTGFAQLEIAALAARLTEERLVYSLQEGEAVGDATASLMKLSWSEIAQEVDEFLLEALGPYAAADQDAAFAARDAAAGYGPPDGLSLLRRYLDGRALTIAGGSSEIQREILARLILPR